MEVLQDMYEFRLRSSQFDRSLKHFDGLVNLVLLDVKLGQSRNADVAEGILLQGLAADLFGVPNELLVFLEEAQGLVDHR
jgi:hypothetical protein